MPGKGENEFKFVVVGFPQAGKSTYAAALYSVCSDCNKPDYRVVRGEEHLGKLAKNLGATKEMPATQEDETIEVAFACPKGEFSFKDYAGEIVVYKETGNVADKFCLLV